MKPREKKLNLYPVWKEDSRNRLSEADIENLHIAWEIHGKQVIGIVRRNRPEIFVRGIASLIV